MNRYWLFAAILFAMAIYLARQAAPAVACSLDTPRLDQSAEYAEYVVVGEVVSEVEVHSGSPEPTVPEYAKTYTSTIRIAAALKGEPPGTLTIGGLGQLGSDCSGGPRLQQGERVLLFVSHFRSPITGEVGALFVPGFDGGKYLLRDGVATSPHADPLTYAADDALRRVAAIAHSPESELDASLAFARGINPALPTINQTPVDAQRNDGHVLQWIILATTVLVAVVSISLFSARSFLRRP